MTLGPLIVQSDRTVLLEVAHADAESARHELAIFAELERAPEHIHTYRVTRLGLWNARAAGHTADEIVGTLPAAPDFYDTIRLVNAGQAATAEEIETLEIGKNQCAATTSI